MPTVKLNEKPPKTIGFSLFYQLHFHRKKVSWWNASCRKSFNDIQESSTVRISFGIRCIYKILSTKSLAISKRVAGVE